MQGNAPKKNNNTKKTSLTPLEFSYTMGTQDSMERHILEITSIERDLGIRLTNNLKWSTHVKYAANKANSVLGTLRRTFMYWTKETTKTLSTTFVRTHLKLAASIWNPYRKKDEQILESVQRRATKLAPELMNLDYSARLKALGLTTLKARRERGDIIQYYKISGNLNKVNFVRPNQVAPSTHSEGPARGIRGSQHRLQRQKVKACDQREYYFSNRIVPLWNALPAEVVYSNTVNQFKARYDNHI